MYMLKFLPNIKSTYFFLSVDTWKNKEQWLRAWNLESERFELDLSFTEFYHLELCGFGQLSQILQSSVSHLWKDSEALNP